MKILQDAISMLFRMPLGVFASPMNLFDLFTKEMMELFDAAAEAFVPFPNNIGGALLVEIEPVMGQIRFSWRSSGP